MLLKAIFTLNIYHRPRPIIKRKPKNAAQPIPKVIISPPTPQPKTVQRCCPILSQSVHSNIEMSAGKVFKRKGSVDKYMRRASASKKIRLSQPVPPRKLNLSDSLLDSSCEEFRLNLSDEDVSENPGLDAATLEPYCVEAATLEPVCMDAATLEPVCVDAGTLEPECVDAATLEPDCVDAATLEPVCGDAATSDPVSLEAATLEPDSLDAATLEPDSASPVQATPGVLPILHMVQCKYKSKHLLLKIYF